MPSSPITLITGAGSGIGRATAITLARHGHRLVLVGRRIAPLEQTARLAMDAAASAEPSASSPDCLIVTADVAAPDGAGAAVMLDAALTRFPRLDTLINNAGHAPLLPISRHTPAILDRIFAVNALAPAYAIARAWPIFTRQRSGCIINISTMGTVDPFPGFFGYAAAKASVNLMARSCANEGRDLNIRAFAIAPGAVDTEMFQANFPDYPASRRLRPDSVAATILECIRGDRDAQNGQTILLPSP